MYPKRLCRVAIWAVFLTAIAIAFALLAGPADAQEPTPTALFNGCCYVPGVTQAAPVELATQYWESDAMSTQVSAWAMGTPYATATFVPIVPTAAPQQIAAAGAPPAQPQRRWSDAEFNSIVNAMYCAGAGIAVIVIVAAVLYMRRTNDPYRNTVGRQLGVYPPLSPEPEPEPPQPRRAAPTQPQPRHMPEPVRWRWNYPTPEQDAQARADMCDLHELSETKTWRDRLIDRWTGAVTIVQQNPDGSYRTEKVSKAEWEQRTKFADEERRS